MESQKGKSTTRAKNKYNAKNYDSMHIVVPKGRKHQVMAVAEAAGDSLNGYVSKAIEERIVRNSPAYTKVYTIIGGVNGTGKSSFSGVLKAKNEILGDIIDVDKITAVNKVFPLEGGKIALRYISEYLSKKKSFTQETTLAGHKTESTAIKAKELGYYIRLYYIGLDSPEECLKRIANRVARGGHDIGEVDVRRRFSERWKAVGKILAYCDEAVFFDNDNGFIEVAELIGNKIKLIGNSQPSWVLEMSEYLKIK